MKTFIIHATNHPGMEWVSDEGETEIIVASTLQEALDSWRHLESIDDILYNQLDCDEELSNTLSDILPLNVSITEFPTIGREVPKKEVVAALQSKIDIAIKEVCTEFAASQDSAKKKQEAINKLKEEAIKLGITLEDLR